MGGGLTGEASTVAPMLGVLGDDSSSSKSEVVGDGDASPQKDVEANSADRHRPMVSHTMVVSEGEAEAQSPAALFWSMAFHAVTQRAEDAGATDAVLSPLHLGELPFIFVLLGYLSFKFYRDLTYFDCSSLFDEGPRQP